MRPFLIPVLVVVSASLLAGCGGGDDVNGSNPRPANVTDLAAIAAGDSTITLTWTAPAIVTKSAAVQSYDLRYSASPITTETWDAATAVDGEPAPAAAGEAETLAVGDLDLGATYHFALRSLEEGGEWSGLSNIATASTDSIDDRLIAFYPLIADANDATGHYGPMTLTHTPFQDGGIYSNGIYIGDDAVNGALAITPSLDSLDFGAFTIRARFRVDSYAAQPGNPVFIGGDLYRWVGYYLEADSTVSLMFGGGSRQASDVVYTPGTWHEGTVTYDGTTARLYLDDTFACERAATINHGDNRNVGTSNGSTGYAFEGVFGRLGIYDGVVTP